MKTTLHFVDKAYERVKASQLAQVVSGSVFKYQKPKGWAGEAVVINSLPVSAEQVQTGLININVFVPDLKLTIGAQGPELQPNTARLSELADMAVETLKSWYQDGTDYSIEAQSLIKDDEGDNHYINFRVRVYALNP
ncbi:hypothetical protein SAMN05444008_102373 [Cnuella takakiae]|uniref:Uncharacterized protein n=1 Tax=Cnuella takakiae TaxID=1302690 RepID=A0A1M4VTE5_9BACT|nr:hypothetical protein [Cnuella takakiae]OLY92507.1 hypothetical protein BUE76_11865 [Cnuella takakiae]SHE72135.1 hypothetical protein SAMN05444008_102373 [Cnuella takakiae]